MFLAFRYTSDQKEIRKEKEKIKVSGNTFQKIIIASEKQFKRVSPLKVVSSLWDILLNPGEKPFIKNSLVKEIAINYPSNKVGFFGWKTDWLILFFVLSIIAGFAFKGVF